MINHAAVQPTPRAIHVGKVGAALMLSSAALCNTARAGTA